MKPLKYLLVATRNKGKAREIAQILAPMRIEVKTLNDLEDNVEIIEDGSTFEENARKKALAAFQAAKIPVLADDSGLEVEALGGKPGVHSARYAGENASDQANNAKLLDELNKVGANTPEERRARFVCKMVFFDGSEMIITTGEVKGYIGFEPKGSNGFGYDPLFVVEGFEKTAAELTPDHKNRISHRGKALAAMIQELKARGYLE